MEAGNAENEANAVIGVSGFASQARAFREDDSEAIRQRLIGGLGEAAQFLTLGSAARIPVNIGPSLIIAGDRFADAGVFGIL